MATRNDGDDERGSAARRSFGRRGVDRSVGREREERVRRGFHPGVLFAIVALIVAFFAFFNSSEPSVQLRIASGSENQALEPIVQEWAEDSGVAVEMVYMGSVDIARTLELGVEAPFDAVWPAHSLWIAYGDRQRVVKSDQSIVRMPVVLAVKRSIAARLAWVGRSDVTIDEIRKAAEQGLFRLAMTSATQSNSGASAYLGFLYAMAGRPDVLTLGDLDKPEVQEGARALLSAVDRSSGSSGWLKDAFVDNPDRFDAMFNYEAMAIEANRSLVAAGREPLYLIYPADGLSVADSPLGLVSKDAADSDAKARAFAGLQEFLLSEATQARLAGLGRRAGLIGLDVSNVDREVWNPDWGIDLTRAIAPIPTPERAVIEKALSLYQTDLRKPSLTIWVLDVSGSMEGEPLTELKRAMRLLLDPVEAERALLSPSSKDVTIVITFNNNVRNVWTVEGNDPDALGRLLDNVQRLRAGGGTDLYKALQEALRLMSERDVDGKLFDSLPAIVAMTDGRSRDARRDAFLRALRDAPFGQDIPIHAIAFGEADERQLEELTRETVGRLFVARKQLADALRKAKGYN